MGNDWLAFKEEMQLKLNWDDEDFEDFTDYGYYNIGVNVYTLDLNELEILLDRYLKRN